MDRLDMLKPCPFCGAEGQGIKKLNTVACSSLFCGAAMRWSAHEPFEKVVAAWNTRANLNDKSGRE